MPFDQLHRREFMTLLGGAAVAWPLAAHAQQHDRVRRLAVLLPYHERDPEGQTNLAALRKRLAELGWADGRNIQMVVRWSAGDGDQIRSYAAEFARMWPDVMFGVSTPVLH